MKKIFVLTIISLTFFMNSCLAPKAIANAENSFRGNWTITDISFTGVQKSLVNTKLFDEAKVECYEGSRWSFVKNNHSGNYSLSSENGCSQVNNKIMWFVSEEGGEMYFKFKRIPNGEKAKRVTSGYKMKLIANEGNQMKMMQEVPFEGKKLHVNYTFTKNQ